jgi:hypothetical protein
LIHSLQTRRLSLLVLRVYFLCINNPYARVLVAGDGDDGDVGDDEPCEEDDGAGGLEVEPASDTLSADASGGILADSDELAHEQGLERKRLIEEAILPPIILEKRRLAQVLKAKRQDPSDLMYAAPLAFHRVSDVA